MNVQLELLDYHYNIGFSSVWVVVEDIYKAQIRSVITAVILIWDWRK